MPGLLVPSVRQQGCKLPTVQTGRPLQLPIWVHVLPPIHSPGVFKSSQQGVERGFPWQKFSGLAVHPLAACAASGATTELITGIAKAVPIVRRLIASRRLN